MTKKSVFALAMPATKIRTLFYGPHDSGKTLAGLSFPRLAVIDSERGTGLHVPYVKPFHVYHTRTLEGIDEALEEIREDNGTNIDALMLDSTSVIYDGLKSAAGKMLSYRERAIINDQMTALYNKLSALNVHVVLTAREAPIYENAGRELRTNGLKPDTDPGIFYMPDFIIRLKADHTGVVEKSRGYKLPDTLKKVDWSVFEPIVANPAIACAKEWLEATIARTGLDAKAIRKILGISQMREFGDWCDPATIARADAMIAAALEAAKSGAK